MDLSFMENIQYGNIKDFISNISYLIKKFFEMIKSLVDGFRKVPNAANGTPTNP
jgi:hypothetical protein